MADIFISYATEDAKDAEALVQILEKRDWTVFWDRQLLPGPNYRQVLADELNQARCVIVLWSSESVKNDWVTDEAEEGKKGSRLVSVLIDDLLPPLGFRQGQAARLWDWDGESENAETTQLLEGVAAVINQTGKARKPPPVDQSPPAGKTTVRPGKLAEPEPGSFLSRHPVIMPTLLLAIVFTVNYLQTATDADTTLTSLGAAGGYPMAEAFSWFETYLSFESHDVTNKFAYKGYSVSYFFLFPLMLISVAIALACRQSPQPFRTLSLAVVINYLISLPFYIFLPVPERWAYPDSGAILLSDLWYESLIEFIRPISGLDNCFPSSHTSLTVIAVAICYLYNVRLKTSFFFIGATIILATFVLGIHWIPDIIAGTLAGLLSVALAYRFEKNGQAEFLWH